MSFNPENNVTVLATAAAFVDRYRYHPDAVLLTTVAGNRILAVNPGFVKLTEYRQDEVVERTTAELELWVDPQAYSQLIRSLNQQGAAYNQELALRSRSGQVLAGLVSVELIDLDRQPQLLTIVRDISAYRYALGTLQARNQRLQAFETIASSALYAKTIQAVLHSAVGAIALATDFPAVAIERYDPERNTLQFAAVRGVPFSDSTVLESEVDQTLSGRAVRTSQPVVMAAETTTSEMTAAAFSGLDLQTIVCIPMSASRDIYGVLSLGHPQRLAIEESLLTWLVAIADYVAAVAIQKQQEERLSFAVFHDPLTGLPNRSLLLDRLRWFLCRRDRQRQGQFALLAFDLDRFQVVNDTLGYTVGDLLLVEACRRLQQGLRRDDTLARTGGDEFAIVLDGIGSATDAARVANRVQAILNEPFFLGGQEVLLAASIGIVTGESEYESPQDMLRDANTAVARAKAAGKARYEILDTVLHQRAQEVLQFERELQQAIASQQLLVYYQPTVSFRTGKIDGIEVQVRWQHPQRGLLEPNELFTVVEDADLLAELDRWLLRHTCNQLQVWQLQFDDRSDLPPFCVNLSAHSRQLQELLQWLRDLLLETSIEPSYLRIGLPERALLEEQRTTLEQLRQLGELGIRLSIVEYASQVVSLSLLADLPVERLSIAQPIVRELLAEDNGEPTIRAITALAASLEIAVVANGIETTEQLSRLRLLGCEAGQGFFFSSPIEEEAMRTLFASDPQW